MSELRAAIGNTFARDPQQPVVGALGLSVVLERHQQSKHVRYRCALNHWLATTRGKRTEWHKNFEENANQTPRSSYFGRNFQVQITQDGGKT